MNIEEFKSSLNELGIQLTDEQLKQFAQYYELLIAWNEKINLTAITEVKEVYLKHFYDSIMLVKGYNFSNADLNLCDVGAGAGFPSLPLKIVFPNLKITIVDSLNKRINFLQTVVNELGLEHVALYHSRAEDFGQNKEFRYKYDIVTARAVARLNILSELCLPLVKKEGVFIALKAAKTEEELVESKSAISILGGKLMQSIDMKLPIVGDERHLVIIKKVKETPNKYPRKAGIPNKKPL